MDPNARLAAKWIKPVKNTQALATAAMEAGILNRKWLVGLTVRMMTQSGLCLIALGGLLFVHSWSDTMAIVISSVGLATFFVFFLVAFIRQCIAFSKRG